MKKKHSKNYVGRPSQITKGPPTRRLRKRRKRNMKSPKAGFFPNPGKVSGRPLLYKICIQKDNGPKMHYDGTKFSQRARVELFSTIEAADKKAILLSKQFPVLRKYRMTIDSNFR